MILIDDFHKYKDSDKTFVKPTYTCMYVPSFGLCPLDNELSALLEELCSVYGVGAAQ